MTSVKRCAVYTRKSTEEGLDQAFNSLHAQREACEAYVKSQAHEGWKLVKTAYDDGGLSGGNMERPALRQLLADVEAGRVHIIVVYKVDRLTRSLADFAKIVDVLDSHSASFVSITQQFNTTTSMGRLTLNMLLSFAQFEREVAGERIRDKVAASRRKGMWMGGTIPLGYDVKARELVVNEVEAATVRQIFELYVKLGSVRDLQTELKRLGIVSKRWVSTTGRTRGGVQFGRSPLYWLLHNPVYVGRVRHKGEVYEGRQAPIVDLPLWEKAQELLLANSAPRKYERIIAGGRLLAGRLFDDRGNAMSPSYSHGRSSKRYAYYVSQALLQNEKKRAGSVPRVRAEEIERLVSLAIRKPKPVDSHDEPEEMSRQFERIVIYKDRLEIIGVSACEGEDDKLVVPAKLAHRNRAVVIDDGTAKPDPMIARALARAHEWREWLDRDEVHSYRDIANKAEVDPSYVQILMPLAFLDPQITRELLDGRCQISGGLIEFLRRGIPSDWQQQRSLFQIHSPQN
jgi:DNA invertase Pin-like site-specific DNA recombinase